MLEGADPAPRWTLHRLVGWVRERFGCLCCRETIRAALHRLTLSWKKAKTLLGRADPEQRQAFVEQLQGVLDGAQRDRHLLVYLATVSTCSASAPPRPPRPTTRPSWPNGRRASLAWPPPATPAPRP